MRILLSILFCALCSLCLNAQGKNALEVMSTSTSSQVSLLTCGQGPDAVSAYGHTAIRIYDPTFGQDLVFNYGTYNFNTPNFLVKFVRGKLPYSLSASRMDSFMTTYGREGRSVTENIFDLDSLQKQNFILLVNENYKKENRKYLYDFFFDNCSTRVWDILASDSNSEYELPTTIQDLTYRDMIKRYQSHMPWTDFGIDIIIGSLADQKTKATDQMFLPDFVQDLLKQSSVEEKPILKKDEVLIPQQLKLESPFFITPLILILALLIFEVFLFFRKSNGILKTYDAVYFFLLFLIGAILAFMWLGTDHLATHRNYNLLWASPLYVLLLLPFSRRAKKIVSFFLIGISVIAIGGIFGLLPQPIPALALGLILVSFLKMYRLYFKDQTQV